MRHDEEQTMGLIADECNTKALRRTPVEINDEICRYHQPNPAELERINRIRSAALNFLVAIDECCPRSADATDAKRDVRRAMMTANASIVLRGLV